jgi:hypothetical protein
MENKVDILELASRLITLLGFGFAVFVFFVSPLMAVSWSKEPFPGFLVEQTLVINGIQGSSWEGQQQGLVYPQRVVRVDGVAVSTPAEYEAEISQHRVSQQISIFTGNQDGSSILYPSVTLQKFPPADLMRLFWLPYLVGLAYLGIGFWVYRVRGQSRVGRALAFFCIVTALTCVLIFDLSTSHAAPYIWVVAIVLTGGALLSLAMRFPQEWHLVTRHPWMLAIPYAIAILLAGWNLYVLISPTNAWAYISTWGVNYRFVAIAILFFLGMTIYHAYSNPSALVRRQSRIVLVGSVIAFTPIMAYFLAPLFGLQIPFNTALLLPFLLAFPISIGLAIMRYRLLEVDALVNRTIVYGTLTAILAGMFTAMIGLSQKLFVALTGEKSDVAIVITTFVVAASIVPFRTRLQKFVDMRLKSEEDNTVQLRSFGKEVQAYLQMNDPQQITHRLLQETVQSLDAEGAIINVHLNGRTQILHKVGNWRGKAAACIPLECQGQRYGLLFLGARKSGRSYSQQEFTTLETVANQVARTVHISLSYRTHIPGEVTPKQ